jgi:hypothetical protein
MQGIKPLTLNYFRIFQNRSIHLREKLGLLNHWKSLLLKKAAIIFILHEVDLI